MKPSNPTLNALLASRQFYAVDIYVFTLADGTVLNYCAGDRDIIFNAVTYPCGGMTGPYFERAGKQNGLCSWKTGLEVSTLQFDVMPGSAQINGVDFIVFCKIGGFDMAACTLYRAYMPTYGDTSAGFVNKFTGTVVEIDIGGSVATFNINSPTELLNQQMPKEIYQASCMNTLFDAGCTLSRASFAVNSAVAAGSTLSQINASLAQATGYFDQGVIVFTSGLNNGFRRSVKSFVSGGTFSLLAPLSFNPAIGDTFTIYPGCDRLQSTCSGKFSNLANFRGQPYIPAPETGV